MRWVIWFVFSVGGVVLALLSGVVWLRARPHSPRPRRFLTLVAAVYAVLSIYGVSSGASRLLMVGLHPFAPADLPVGRTAVVVLGSGGFTARDWASGTYSIVNEIDATRSVEAARVFRLAHAEWIISSGGKSDPDDPHEASGNTIRNALVALGVPASQILVETESRNTHDEAVLIAPMLRDLNIQNTVLVTSGDHMRRSLGAFRSEGVPAIPAIARDPYGASSWVEWMLPSRVGLAKGASVMHELIGTAYYVGRGWYDFR